MLLFLDPISVTESCPGTTLLRLTSDKREQRLIRSPNYPSEYNSKQNCTWNLRSPAGTKVTLKVEDFHLEKDYDYLNILDGDNIAANYIDKLTGHIKREYTAKSSGNAIFLQFTSDNTRTKKGFSIIYDYEGRQLKTRFYK